MEIKVIKEVENRPMDRKEIYLNVISPDSTPSSQAVREEASKKLNLNPENVVVVRIRQLYGIKASEAVLHCYSKKETMEKIVKRRGKGGKKKEGATEKK
jgi:ribosomal protein S24E